VSQTAIEDRLGAGGEAEVLAVPGRPELAFKRYRSPNSARTAKSKVMLEHPPDDRPDIAWPLELVPGSAGQADGFIMRRVNLRRNVPLFQVYNPGSRHKVARAITWRYLIRTARNTAAIVDALHRAGYVVGDLNESNLLVDGRAVVTLLDCDSMQVRDPADGRVFPCAVGKPEFTPPELHRANLATTERTQEGDAFGLAVLVFLLLLEGTHPFASVWRGGGDPPDIGTRIRSGALPYKLWLRLRHRVSPPPLAVPLSALPWSVRRLVRRSFTVGLRRPSRRPTAREWVDALDRTERRLQPCRRSPHHLKSHRLARCPWCRRIDGGVADPFPGPDGTGLTPRSPARWRMVLRRVPPPPAAVVGVAAAAAVGAWLPTLTVAGLCVAIVGLGARGGVRAALAEGRPVAARVAMGIGAAPVVAASLATQGTVPSLPVFAGRVAGAVVAGLLALRLPGDALAPPRRRWVVTGCIVAMALFATQVTAWWWPLRL
jgi:DNA-binding helix-hairpin-helix protein with protein kinase domain